MGKELVVLELTLREDCAEAGCRLPPEECDVCHTHDMPCDEEGMCEECEVQ